MDKIKILWADDEIALLKPHILFLDGKGYEVVTALSGDEAIDIVREDRGINAVLLDENMPGISGLETLLKIKQLNSDLPVIMITKSEEEHIMDDAIGGKIADYLIKPVNPNQILLSLKKALDNRRLVSEKTNTDYRKEFGQIGMTINENLGWEEWAELYKKIIYWELEMDKLQDKSMLDVLKMQKSDANNQFFKFIEKHYVNWLSGKDPNPPIMSHTLIKNRFLQELGNGPEPVFFILIDNLRFDQWKMIQPLIQEYYKVDKEESYYSILPTATQYARNAIFSGLMPSEIEKRFPDQWLNDEEEGGKKFTRRSFYASANETFGQGLLK